MAFFKTHYELIQNGDYYRLTGCDRPVTAWEQVSPNRREALVSLVYGAAHAAAPFRILRFKGLDPALHYQVNGEGAYTGDTLMNAGWPLPLQKGDYLAMQFYLEAV